MTASDDTRVPEQPELGFDFKSQVDGSGMKLLAAITAAIDSSGKRGDGFAEDLDLDPAQLSRALNGRGAHFSVRWLPAVLWRDHDHRVISLLARMCGGEFVPKPVMTREEKVLRVLAYVEERAGDLGLDLITKALGSDAP